MKRLTLKEEETFGDYELSGTIPEIIEWLQEKHKEGWETMEVEYDEDEELMLVFSRYRQETDKEFFKRKSQIEKEKQNRKKTKAEQAKKELALYQKLKLKYEIL